MTKTVFIKDIFESPPTNSGLKKKDVILKRIRYDLIPVYSASKDGSLIFGWVDKNTKWKIYENLLTWNKDGSVGRVFYRKEKFVPYEKVKLLKIKKDFDSVLDYEYLKYAIENKLLSYRFGFNFKCSMERVLKIPINIPIDEKGNFDLKEQKRLADKYKKIYDLKDKIGRLYEEIKNLKVDMDADYETKEVSLSNDKYFDIFIGKRVLKKEVFDSKGNIPVYSANVSIPFGFLDKSNIRDFSHDYLLWGIDGNFEFNIIKKGVEFATTDHCGAIKILDDNIMPEYLLYGLNLNKDLIGYDRTLRASLTNMKKVSMKIPVNEKGIFDYNKQKEIAERYIYVEKIKEKIADEMDIILKANIEIEQNSLKE